MALSNSIKDNLASIICFSAVLLFALWSNPHLNGYFEIDTQSYIMVAHNFLCSWSQDRPIGYPLFLRLCMLISDAYWVPMVIIIQFIILSSMACILLRLFLDYNIALFVALPAAIIIGICPNLINPASDILPELMFGWFILLAWYQVNHINVSGGGKPRIKLFIQAAVVGVCSGIAVLIKPVWLLGIIALAAGFIIANIKDYRKALNFTIIMICAHLTIWWSWQIFLVIKFNQFTPSRVASVNLNLAIIRYGLTKEAAGTPLYNYLERNGLLKKAEGLTWNDFDQFTNIKNNIPWSERIDPSFNRQVLFNNPFLFVEHQLLRIPRFFINRPSGVGNDSFPYMPKILRYIYYGSFNLLFWPLMPFLLLISLTMGICIKRFRLLIATTGFIIIYLAITLALLTYQDPLFTRMRACLIPEMLFMAFLPICVFVDYLIKNKNRIPSSE